MSIKREEVQRIAALAKLEPTEAQLELYATQLASILDYIEVLKTLPDEGDVAMEGLAGTPLRPDEVRNAADPGFGLAQAPDRDGDCFRVPRILE